MNANLPRYNDASLLVVGDVMLDRYMTGATRRISPEAPVPVVNVGETEDRPGGAANVAQSIVALGASARLIGLTGDDDDGTALAWQLTRHAVETDFVRVPDLPTIVKLRVLSHGQQLLRLDFEQDFIDNQLEEFVRYDVKELAVNGNHSFYTAEMELKLKDGSTMLSEQAVATEWKDGKIFRERYYHA